VLSKPRRESPYSKVTVRPVLIDDEPRSAPCPGSPA
jgi:hypothetical protein